MPMMNADEQPQRDGGAERKKRPSFQIHLSTAVVLMLLAGILVGLNAIPSRYRFDIEYGVHSPIMHAMPPLSAPKENPSAR